MANLLQRIAAHNATRPSVAPQRCGPATFSVNEQGRVVLELPLPSPTRLDLVVLDTDQVFALHAWLADLFKDAE